MVCIVTHLKPEIQMALSFFSPREQYEDASKNLGTAEITSYHRSHPVFTAFSCCLLTITGIR